MNINKNYLAFIFVLAALVGCGGGGSSADNTAYQPKPVVISALDITAELTEQGQTLRAVISCMYCHHQTYQIPRPSPNHLHLKQPGQMYLSKFEQHY